MNIKNGFWIWLSSVVSLTVGMTNATCAQETDPRRPAAIEAREVPVVPTALFEKLAQFQNTRAAAFRGWSPSGHGILIATRFGNSSQLHRVYEPGGRREQITFFDEPVNGDFLPGDGEEALLLSADTGGNENDQIFLLDRKNSSTLRLTDGKSKYRFGPVLHDGSRVIISGNQRNGRDVDFYIADPRQPDSLKLLFPVDRQTWYAADWSRDGRTIVMLRYVSINESYLALLDVATGKKTDLPLPSQGQVAISGLVFAPHGKSLYLATDADSEFRQLARLDLETKKYSWLATDLPWDVSDIKVCPTSGDVAFAINEDGASRLFLLPQGDAAKRRELKLPLGVVAGLEFSPDGQQLGFTLALPTAPADAYSLRLSDGELLRWTFSELGGLNPARFVAPELIRFKTFDGRLIPAYYFRPKTAAAGQKVPVYISIHGGPESQYQPLFSSITQFYASELGVAVIHPNVRGSAGYGKTYLQLDNAERREDSVKDIGGLLDWIAERPELDASRVAVAGGSYGGYMVLASLTHFGDRIRAGVDYVGIANFLTFLEKTAAYRVDLRRAEYGDERDPQMRAAFERISPLNNAHKIRAALMVAHGRNDPRVPFYEAEQIANKVRQQQRPVWTVFAENEGHGFAKKDNSDYVRAVEVLFIQQHLGVK